MNDIYSPDIIGLAQTLRDGAVEDPDASVRRVAKLCGSEIEVDVRVRDGVVAAFAQRVRACALGQASAAMLQMGVVGASADELRAARDALEAMLKSGAPAPMGRFAGLAGLHVVRAYPARHGSVMLPWQAVVEAVEASEATGGQ